MKKADSQQYRARSGLMMLITVIIIIILIPWSRNIVVRSITSLAKPIRAVGRVFNTPQWWTWQPGKVMTENNKLRQQNEKLTSEIARLKAQIEASESLEKLRAFLNATRQRSVSAAIIGFSSDPGILTFDINVGQKDGVKKGMPVVSDSGFLIGKIEQVDENRAVVRQISDSQSRVLARISNNSKSPGIVRGQKGITLEMEFIPRDDEINNSDVVTTSGAEAGIPPDLVIGTVENISGKPGDLFKSASIFSPIRVGTLSVVAVLLGT